MRIAKLTLLLIMLPAVLSAQSNPPHSGLLRSGWVSPVNGKLKPIADPQGSKTFKIDPLGREAGYWRDVRGGSDAQNGVVTLRFVEGSAEFDKGHDNARALAILEHTFYNTTLIEDMEYVTITAASSPEGTTADNERLAAKRALAIKEHIMAMFPYLDRDRLVTYSAGEDWQGLKRMIEEDEYTPGRDEALRLLGSPLTGNLLRERLQKVAGGTTYAYITANMFPALRGGAACMIYYKSGDRAAVSTPVEAKPAVKPEPEPEPAQPVENVVTFGVEPMTDDAPATREPIVMDVDRMPLQPSGVVIKSNLLYDLAGTINLGAEFGIGQRFSLDVPISYNGWELTKGKTWKHILVQPELRYWATERFEGHFFGLHAHYADYDMGGLPFSDHMKANRFDGWLAGAGLSYGYRWNFRNPRWGMEATLGVGYVHLDYERYRNGEGGENSCNVKQNWIAPTKAGVNLIYTIGSGR